MNDSMQSNLNQDTNQILAQRAIEPDVSKLAEKIILISQSLPQDIVKPNFSVTLLSRLRQIFAARSFSSEPLVFRGAIACLMFLVISGVWFFPQTGVVNNQQTVQNISIDGDFLSEEFSWDSLLMMQDELAFAEL